MSTSDPPQAARPTVTQYAGAPASGEYRYDDTSGEGWVMFAASMLGLLAVLNFIDGLAAVSNSKFFVNNAQFVISNLNTYGWALIILSVCLAGLAIGIGMRVKGLRWIGVLVAAVNAIVQLAFIPAYPFWSLALFSLDILVIYGLVAHGAKSSAA
jgi:predicted membrane protein